MAIQFDNSVATTITLAAPSSGSATLTFPAADGTSGQALITDGSGNLTWGAAPTPPSSGLTATANTTGTNATINVDALTIAVAGSSTNQSIALIPKGAGSLGSFIPTNAFAGYGNRNVVFQKSHLTIYPITDENVILGGSENYTNGGSGRSVTIGCNRVDARTNAVALGLGSPLASYSSASGLHTVLALSKAAQSGNQGATAYMGPYLRTWRAYQHQLGGISYDPNAMTVASYYSLTHYTGQTPGSGAANAVFLYSDFNNSTTNGNFNVPGRSLIFFWGWLTAGQNSGNAAYVWEIAGLAISTGSVLTFVGTPVVAALGGDASLSTSVITLAISGLNITIKAQSALTGTTNFQFTCNEILMGVY